MRILPEGLDIDVEYDAWERPAIFNLIQQLGGVPEEDMRRTFNLGVGLIAAVPYTHGNEAVDILRAIGEQPFRIGTVVAK